MSATFSPHSPIRQSGQVISCIDWRGNRFKRGDLVAFCLGTGLSQQIAVGRVKLIYAEKKPVQQWDDIDPDDPLRNHKAITEFVDVISVQVAVTATANGGKNTGHHQPFWVKAQNVTALRQTGLGS